MNLTIEDHPVHLHLVNLHLLNRQMFDPVAYSLANPRPPLHTKWAPPPDDFLLGASRPPAPWEAGPKDTVNCPQNTVTRFLVHFPAADELGFAPDATFTPARHAMSGMTMAGHDRDLALQGYVWHCHMLEHEDDCMMARYRLVE